LFAPFLTRLPFSVFTKLFKMNLFLLQPFSQGSLWHVDHGFLGILISQAIAYVAMGFYFIFIPEV
jgi:hypothetical protein